jgi:hypothetical protein
LQVKHQIESEVLPRSSARRLDNALKLIRSLYAQPIIDVKRAAEIIGGTGKTAASLINGYHSLRLLCAERQFHAAQCASGAGDAGAGLPEAGRAVFAD